MICQVVLWSNNVTTATDEAGRKLPDYQGRRDIMRAKILRDAPAEATFHIGYSGWDPPRVVMRISREDFASHPGFPPTYAR